MQRLKSTKHGKARFCRIGKTTVLFFIILLLLCFLLVQKLEISSISGFKLRSNSQVSPNGKVEDMIMDIKENYLHPPSTDPYNLKEPNIHDPSRGQTNKILAALSNQRNGFFVECGALDGETRSNTLYMERFLGWQGLLVEADPKNFALLLQKQRKTWSINVCLNNGTTKGQVVFKPNFNIGQIDHQLTGASSRSQASGAQSGLVVVDCFPLHAVLLAMNRTVVDYFSLDVEGAELEVLRSIPFDRINIRTLSVEYIHIENGGKEALREFMIGKGYTVIAEVTQPDWTANDFIFVKNSEFPEIVAKVPII